MKNSLTDNSEKLFKIAQECLVGGVNSPVRAFSAVKGKPRFIKKAKGPYLIDVDSNQYIDFVGSWGPMILGHNPPAVLEAVKKTLANGISFGACSPLEIDLAQLILKAFPSMEQIRFTSSGTEATMSALRLARGITKRERILKFEGAYHGHADALLVSAGSGATTFGIPSSAGVVETLARYTWVLPYNNFQALENLFRTQGPNIAAVIVEPICGNMGVVNPLPDFLEALRELTKKFENFLIFDEVMTGFRVAWGGAQNIYGIEPDITCLGKIIGGGFPVGAFGGKREFMQKLAPLGPVYHAGTLSGNPVAMAAGLATLKELEKKKPYGALEKTTNDLKEFILKTAEAKKVPVQVNSACGMFTVFFSDQPVQSYFDALLANTDQYAVFFQALLNCGVYFPPSQFEAAFISTAHTLPVLEKAKGAIASALEAVQKSRLKHG